MSDLLHQIGDYVATNPTDDDFIMFCNDIIVDHMNKQSADFKVYHDHNLSYLLTEDVKIIHIFQLMYMSHFVIIVNEKILVMHLGDCTIKNKFGIKNLDVDWMLNGGLNRIWGTLSTIPHKARFNMEIRDLFTKTNIKSARN